MVNQATNPAEGAARARGEPVGGPVDDAHEQHHGQLGLIEPRIGPIRISMRLTCRCRVRAADGCGGGRAGAGGGCGARGAGVHAGCWEQSSWLLAATSRRTLADAGGLDSAQARSREPRALAEAVEAASGGQWPTRRGEERLRATRPRSRARFGTPPAATGSGARRATAGLGGKRAEMAAPSTS